MSRFRHSRGFFTTIQNALGIFVGTMIFREVDHSDLIANQGFDIGESSQNEIKCLSFKELEGGFVKYQN